MGLVDLWTALLKLLQEAGVCERQRKEENILTVVMRASTDWYLCRLPDLLNAVHALFDLTFTAALEVGYSCGSYFEVIDV